ncbi:MAG: hypothetical protein ACYTEL_24445 [Planctomycetota bacterium]
MSERRTFVTRAEAGYRRRRGYAPPAVLPRRICETRMSGLFVQAALTVWVTAAPAGGEVLSIL